MSTTTTGPTLFVPNCPRCHGPMFDNRTSKLSPKAPDFRCQRPQCVDEQGRRSALWERDLFRVATKLNGKTTGSQNVQLATAPTSQSPQCQAISAAHLRALQFVTEHELPLIKSLGGNTAGAVIAATATLFIELQRRQVE